MDRFSRRIRFAIIAAAAALAVFALVVGGVSIRSASAAPQLDPVLAQRAYDDAAAKSIVLGRHYTKIAVIGDSYTAGSAMGGTSLSENWTAPVAIGLRDRGHIIEMQRKASGGSGYVEPGPKKTVIPELVGQVVTPQTELLVAFGSRNDAGLPGISEAVSRTLDEARQINPRIRLLVIGPPWIDENVPADMLANRDAVRSAAERAGATFVDPIQEGWFAGRDARLIGTDRIHPTAAGHAYMGGKILPHMEDMLRSMGA